MIYRTFCGLNFRRDAAEGTSPSAAFRTQPKPSSLTELPVSPIKQELQVESRHSLAPETEIKQ